MFINFTFHCTLSANHASLLTAKSFGNSSFFNFPTPIYYSEPPLPFLTTGGY